MPLSSHSISGSMGSTLASHDVNLTPWLSSQERVKLTYFPFHTPLFGSESIKFTSWRGGSIYIWYLELFCKKSFSLLLHLSIFSISYLYQHEFMYFYFMLWAIIQHYVTYFVAQLYQLTISLLAFLKSCSTGVAISLFFSLYFPSS